jgi:carboxymethylenebutenolidase
MQSDMMLPVGSNQMHVRVARPPTPDLLPGIVLIHHRGGIDKFTARSAERLAANGFHVAAPNLFHRRPPGEDTAESRKHLSDGEVVADIAAAVDYLRSLPTQVRGDALAIMGHCMGGRMAYLGAAANPHFKAAVVLYGGGILRGEGEGRPAPIELTKNISGPVLGLFGKEDTNPSPADVAAIDAALTEAKIRHAFHSYEKAGHAFQNFEDKERYRHDAAEDAWKRIIAFLKAELQPSA